MAQSPSKSDLLYHRMRADILALRLEPGCALRLPALSELYGLGVTPIRECLNRLSTDKLVVIQHNKGFRVAELSMADLLDLERGRSAVEGALFALAIEQGNDAWEATIIGAYHHLSAVSPVSVLDDQPALDQWNRRHGAFHDALIAGADAPWLRHFHLQLKDQVGRYQLFIQKGLRDLHKSHPDAAPGAAHVYAKAMALEPHGDLYEAALSRDHAIARAVVERHVNFSIEAFEHLAALLPADAGVGKAMRMPAVELHP